MAITSLVFGIAGFLCLGFLAGLPAIVLGHIAFKRARKAPDQYGGAPLAAGGFVLGYLSLITSVILIGAFMRVAPQVADAKSQAQRIACFNNMKGIGLAFRIWASQHEDRFPFNTSTNKSQETIEAAGADAATIFGSMGKELGSPRILVCPGDPGKHAAASFSNLGADNVSYEIMVGSDVNSSNPAGVLARCPIHGTELLCDGSVH